jgi:hypothetical protein
VNGHDQARDEPRIEFTDEEWALAPELTGGFDPIGGFDLSGGFGLTGGLRSRRFRPGWAGSSPE